MDIYLRNKVHHWSPDVSFSPDGSVSEGTDALALMLLSHHLDSEAKAGALKKCHIFEIFETTLEIVKKKKPQKV